MSEKTQVVTEEFAARSLLVKLAGRYEVDPDKMMGVLKNTAFRQTGRDRREITNEQMTALAIVANQYGLNPFTGELYAFPAKNGAIVPVIGINGWSRIINEHPEFDGVEFNEVGGMTQCRKDAKPDEIRGECPEGMECVIYRKDRSHATKVTEWIGECYRDTEPWNDMPRRMLRHKALVQCARIAFSFVGVYDEDEGARIIEGDVIVDTAETGAAPHTGGTAAAVNDALKPDDQAEDIEDADIVEDVGESGASQFTGESGTRALLDLVSTSSDAEELDRLRSINGERSASPPDKSSVTKAIAGKFKAMAEGGNG